MPHVIIRIMICGICFAHKEHNNNDYFLPFVMGFLKKINIRKVCHWWAVVYIFIIMLILPAYVENNYFNLIEAKNHCFVSLSIIMLPIGTVLYTVALGRHRIAWKKLNFMDLSVIAFALIAFVSSAFSGNFHASLLGTYGWSIGSLTWMLLAVSYLLISRCLIYRQRIWLPVMAGIAILIMIGVLHAAGIDVFGLHRGIWEPQFYSYYSTIGNVNWWSGYLCLLVPVTAVFLMESHTGYRKAVYWSFWVFLCFGMLICSSDGLYLGFGVCAFFFIPYMARKTKRIQCVCLMAAVFGAVILAFSLLPCFEGRRDAIGSGIAASVMNPWVGTGLMIVGAGCAGLIRITKYQMTARFRRILIILLEAVLTAAVIYFLYRTITEFGDYWGTKRGKIWTDSWNLFQSYNLKDKLIGIGPEMLRMAYAGISEWFGQTVLVSHSEPLQYLLTMGILGLIAWCGIIASSIRYCRYYTRDNNVTAAFFLPFMAYFGQALVNSAMTTNLAMAFLFLAFIRFALGKTRLVLR